MRRSNGSNYYLSGVMTCGRCGHPMVGVSAKVRGGSRHQYYICITRNKYSKNSCDQDSITKDKIEKIVFEQLKEVFNDGKLLNEVLEKVNAQLQKSRPLYEKELASVEREIKEKEALLNKYFKAFESGKMNEESCSKRIKKYSEELKQLKEQRNVLAGKIANNKFEAFKTGDFGNLIGNFEDILRTAPDSQKKATLQKMVKVIKVISRDEIRVTYILPFKKTSSSYNEGNGSPKEQLYEQPDEILFEGPVLSLPKPKPPQLHQKQPVRNPIKLALEYHKLLHSGKYKNKSELAKALNVTRVRIVQILNLLKLDSEVIHKILSLGSTRDC